MIEIDSKLNPNFDPVDLFIRLNNKPFPIKENSFEMWNSFVDKDVIQKIKKITDKNVEWFFIKVRDKDKTSDRMQNEELITMLAYIDFKEDYNNSIGIFPRDEKLNCRIKEKKSISLLLENLSIQAVEKIRFLKSVEKVEIFINNLASILKDNDKKSKLNELFWLDKRKYGYKRSLVDFYILFLLLKNIGDDQIRNISFDTLRTDLQKIQSLLRNSQKKNVDAKYLDDFHFELKRMIKQVDIVQI